MIAKLASQKRRVEIVGHGALRNAGRLARADTVLSTAGLKGVTLYEPTEIVMSARSGTPVYEIEAILAARGQMLAFEPVDLGPATGAPGGALSIGGVFATNFPGLAASLPEARATISSAFARSTAGANCSSPAAA
jgi:glycolate oxidase FAD binding subunit